MEKIEIGEFVRTKYGVILKFKGYLSEYLYIDSLNYEDAIVDFKTTKALYENSRKNVFVGSSNDIANHSFNIKDLVEKGDFVNGYEVDDFDGYDEEGNYFENDLGIPIYDDANMDCIVEYRPIRLMEIKSIVTREMFQKVEYRMEE